MVILSIYEYNYKRGEAMAIPVGIKLDEELQARLKALGERCERSPHWLMKKAICEFLDRVETEEAEKQILFDRWNRYQETGESISHKKVKNWLNTWGTEKERAWPTKQN
jgi:predicted transcriptional regulator